MMNSKNKPKKIDTIVYNNRNVGFSISIPQTWLEVKKTSYKDLGINDNTLFAFAADKFTIVTAVFSGFCKKRSFNKFFDKIRFQENLKILKTGQSEYNNVSVKYVIVETENKKIMHNFCLINEMIINFTINLDPKNKLIDKKGLTTDSNYKMLTNILKNMEIYEPVNPPVLIEDYQQEKDAPVEEINIIKTAAQVYIENDCCYKNILLPDFYLKYIYQKNNSELILSVIDNETYFKGLDDSFIVVRTDEELTEKIMAIVADKTLEIEKCSLDAINEKTNSYIVLKINEKYMYLDLYNEKTDKNLISDILTDIIKAISKRSRKDFSNYEVIPTFKPEIISTNIEPSVADDVEILEEEPVVAPTVVEEPVVEETIVPIIEVPAVEEQKEEEIIGEEPKEKEIPIILPVATSEVEVTENEPIEVQEEVTEETKIEENISDESIEETIKNAPQEVYDISNFEEYYHNVDGHASFKFLFPYNIGEKVIRDFNVFDINDNDSLVFRVFIFKCETADKYEAKLENWMNMNIESNKCNIKEEYKNKTDNGLEIKTFIFENGKFYKATYKSEYLIAISGLNDEEKMTCADIALNTVEIGEDSRSFIESYDRKVKSIKTLQAQSIPYLEELPVIASSYEVEGKNLDEIAKRAIILCVACNFASDILSNKKKRYLKESKKFFNKLLDTFNVKDAMTKDEKTLFDKMDKKLAVQISWQFEGYVVLLWTLGLIDEVQFPDLLVDPDSVTAIVSACDSYREFLEKCSLRDVNEVLDLADLTYRYNWYCVEAKINGEEPIINPEIVMERHRALNWLLSDQKWDKVEINT